MYMLISAKNLRQVNLLTELLVENKPQLKNRKKLKTNSQRNSKRKMSQTLGVESDEDWLDTSLIQTPNNSFKEKIIKHRKNLNISLYCTSRRKPIGRLLITTVTMIYRRMF